MVSSSLLQRDLILITLALPSATSDHKPIYFSLAPSKKLGRIPFRFNPLWLKDSKVLEIIQEAWNTNIFGSPRYIWESKLRATRFALKSWAKLSSKRPSFQKEQIQDDLVSFQKRMEDEEVTMLALNHQKDLNLRMLRAVR